MGENKIERWYWVMDDETHRPILRGGRFSDTEHTEFFFRDIESPDVKAELVKSFELGKKPKLEYTVVTSRKNKELVIITDVKPERE